MALKKKTEEETHVVLPLPSCERNSREQTLLSHKLYIYVCVYVNSARAHFLEYFSARLLSRY